MNSDELKQRTKEFAINIIRLVDSLSNDKTAIILGKQLARAATSVGANYRAACRARSKADFISKITIVEEEADECQY
jgi:four helix bundle protein